jgi:hypothetical protein
MVLLALWSTGTLVGRLTDGLGWPQEERGLVFFLAFVATLPAVCYATRWWWRSVNRLPRRFVARCERCGWSGPCRVYEDRA